ncbi:MAG: methyltransferase [Pseudomonadota bacterium]
MSQTPLDDQQTGESLDALGRQLRAEGYQFTTTTPATHHQVLANRGPAFARTLRDTFGWSMRVNPRMLPEGMSAELFNRLRADGILEPLQEDRQGQCHDALDAEHEEKPQGFCSTVRCSSFEDLLFFHSAYPTLGRDAVFFGPDTYRFLHLIENNMPGHDPIAPPRILDIGCGSGAGGIAAARLCPGARLVLNDINRRALRYALCNARAAGLAPELAHGDALNAVTGDFDIILANPPYLVDDEQRAYRHGGDQLGRELGVRMARQALGRLAPLGRLIVYMGVAIVDGVDGFIEDLRPALADAGCAWTYQELDPDVFGEELRRPVYREAERIAAVGLVAVKP